MVTMRQDAGLSVPRKHVLIAGNIVMLSLLPVIQQATRMFSGHLSVTSGVLTAQALSVKRRLDVASG